MDRYTIFPPKSKIQGMISLNGSKSITNRALIMGALANANSILKNASLSDDSMALVRALQSLGVSIDVSDDEINIQGHSGQWIKKGIIDVGPAGTVARFMCALLSFIPEGEWILTGNERMQERPIGELVDALRILGVEIEYQNYSGCLPLLIQGIDPKLAKGKVKIGGNVSSQFISALLLVAPILGQGLEIEVEGDLVSKSYVDMTIAGMADFGVKVENEDYKYLRVAQGQSYESREYVIEGDASGASYFFASAAISQGSVKVYNLSLESLQGDARFPEVLGEMGCSVVHGFDGERNWIEVSGREPLYGIDVDMSSMPDTIQTLAVVATCSKGVTRISGAETLKNKETNRIKALIEQLQVIGISAEYNDGELIVYGGSPRGGIIKTYGDHRMAMSFAILGSKIEGITIEDPQVVSKSFPSFWHDFQGLGVRVG